MVKCANCELEAKYQYDISPSYAVLYCFKCVPKFLSAQIAQGLLAVKEPEPVVTKSSKKKAVVKEPVAEELVIDEPIIEEAVVEEDATN
jgi:hypothetical protein